MITPYAPQPSSDHVTFGNDPLADKFNRYQRILM